MTLITAPSLVDHDDFYEALLAAHRGLTLEQSHAMNAELVLILANHVGDLETLMEAMALARPERDQ